MDDHTSFMGQHCWSWYHHAHHDTCCACDTPRSQAHTAKTHETREIPDTDDQ